MEQFEPTPRQVKEIRERDGCGLNEARRRGIFANMRDYLPRCAPGEDLERLVQVVAALIDMVEHR